MDKKEQLKLFRQDLLNRKCKLIELHWSDGKPIKVWVARDSNGRINVFRYKPIKRQYKWDGEWMFPTIEAFLPIGCKVPQWSDDEPIEVELKM